MFDEGHHYNGEQKKFLGSLFLIAATAMSIRSIFSCNFIQLNATSEVGNIHYTFGRGLWWTEVDVEYPVPCRPYIYQSYDDVLFAATGYLSAFSLILSTLTTLLWFSCSCPSRSLLGLGTMCILLCLSQSLTLLMIPSSQCKGQEQHIIGYVNVKCVVGDGAKTALASAVLWVSSAIVLIKAARNEIERNVTDIELSRLV